MFIRVTVRYYVRDSHHSFVHQPFTVAMQQSTQRACSTNLDELILKKGEQEDSHKRYTIIVSFNPTNFCVYKVDLPATIEAMTNYLELASLLIARLLTQPFEVTASHLLNPDNTQ